MYNTILFPIDITSKHAWDSSFSTVIELARAFKSKVYLMAVLPNQGMGLIYEYVPKNWSEDSLKKAKIALQDIATKHFPEDVKTEIIIERGSIYQCIVDKATELSSDLIVMAAHRPELRDFLLGPNAAKAVRHAKTSVLIVRS